MKKHSQKFPTFSLVLSLGMAMMTSIPAGASIKETSLSQGLAKSSETLLTLNRSRLGFKVRGIRPSQRREGGLVRKGDNSNSCAGQPLSVTALLPKTNEAELLKKEQIEIESTVSARPTFFVHLTQTTAKNAEFIVLNENREIVFEEKVALTGNPGILTMTLPASAKPLEVGKLYHWSFSVICDPTDSGANMLVDGWVKRIEPDFSLAAQLKKASDRDRAELYTQAGIWTDALSTIADLRKAKPNDPELQNDWKSLLESVKLSTVAEASIIGSINGTTGQ